MNEVLTSNPEISAENLAFIQQSARDFAETHIRPYIWIGTNRKNFP